MNVPLSWGKCTLFILKSGETKWKRLVTPVEDSTNLTPTQGDKLEAKIEGGENEAVKYKKNTYQLVYNIRKAQGRKQPIANTDGTVKDEYSVILLPEDATTDGFYIERTNANVQDSFTTAEGAIWQVTHDALAPTKGNTVKWGKVTVTPASGSGQNAVPQKVAFVENEDMLADGQAAADKTTIAAAEFVDQND